MKSFDSFRPCLNVGLVLGLLAGCAHGPDGNRQRSSVNDDPCNVAASVVGGALLGAIAGKIVGGKDSVMTGALVGGAGGAALCFSINLKSRQVRSASQVNQDYTRLHGALPREPVVDSYTALSATSTTQRGDWIRIDSVLEVTNGSTEPLRSVREEVVLLDPSAAPVRSNSKAFIAKSAGRYENSFEIKLPANAPQGRYSLQMKVFVNDKLVVTRDLYQQIVEHQFGAGTLG
jgi:hypothetical protein